MLDVVFYEAFEEEQKAIKHFLPDGVKAEFTSKTIQESGHDAPPAKLISIRTQSVISEQWAGDLDGVLTRSQGYDHLVRDCRSLDVDITCGYLPAYCSRSVAEHAIMMMLMLMRRANQQQEQFNTFGRDGICGEAVIEKKTLVIGVGRVGLEIVSILKGFKVDIKGVDPAPNMAGLSYVSLEDGITWADVIFCAVPLKEDTKEMLNYNLLKKAKPNIFLVNISRGEVTPTQSMARLFKEDVLGGLALDVFENEAHISNCLRAGETSDKNVVELLELKKYNTVFTPHNAFNTERSLERKAQLSVEEIMWFLQNKTFHYLV